jgi:hypothetical protein
MADRICAQIAQDDTSLRQICKAAGMPHRSTVLRWLDEKPGFAAKYARARAGQADAIFDDMAEIEQKTLDGKVNPVAARAVLGSKQWRASKLAPKKYGEKIQVGGAEDLPPVQSKHSLSDDALAAIAAKALQKQ